MEDDIKNVQKKWINILLKTPWPTAITTIDSDAGKPTLIISCKINPDGEKSFKWNVMYACSLINNIYMNTQKTIL